MANARWPGLHERACWAPVLSACMPCIWTKSELALLASTGTNVAHCPTSNLKLASGFRPVAQMRQLGINVGLGTDGAASNNRLDLFGEMRLASLLAKG